MGPDLGTRLRVIRNFRGYKQHYVAAEVGLSASTLCRIEGGLTDPGYSTVCRILRLLNCTHEDLTIPLRSETDLIRRLVAE